MVRPSRWPAAALAATLAAALATADPAAADPPDPATTPAPATAHAPARVTLITGDQVEVAAAGQERYAVAVEPGAGREQVSFHTMEADGQLLVLPSDVLPYLSAGVLDRRLFDVAELVAQGYHDQASPELPLIMRYRGGARPALGALTAEPLASVDGAAVAPAKESLGELWRDLTPDGELAAAADAEPELAGGIAEIWLDGRVTPVLDRSVPQIGAGQAWDAGYDGSGVTVAVLDTGVDQTHPDLAGKVDAAEDFTGSPSAADGHGHGTHVAATVAGTGAGAGGDRPGVAPGADLLAGKVLDDSGSGYESWIIAGMEWATASGADVVSMSLSGGPTDGTDPMSQAVNQLSEQTGTLFVIAAGNAGTDYAVGSPGAATTALTVGAVDRDDELASFSSRGPRLDDNAPKPEITAPGVGIVAARAAGTSMGSPVDDHYTAASGTSMATPHVAGAAALLAQAHPDWAGDQLKDALVSTADPNPELAPFAQGGGRVDAARSVTQRVHATGVVDFGRHAEPEAATKPLPGQLSYTNATERAVTLDLAVELPNLDTGDDASGAVSLDADEVTVPAGATVDVPVSLDLAALGRGRHAGTITATGPDGVTAHTTIATTLAGPTRTVHFRAEDGAGDPAFATVFALNGTDPRNDHLGYLTEGGRTLEVEEGTYLVHALIPEGNRQYEQKTVVTDPELEITEDEEIVLDTGAATPVRIETPKPAEQRAQFSFNVYRELANGRTIAHGTRDFSTVRQLNVTPTAPLSAGEYEFSSRWQLVAPMVTARVPGLAEPPELNLLHQSPAFDGERRFRLVWAGTGSPEDLADAGVTDAVALMETAEGRSEQEQVAAAAEAGAAAALIVRPATRSPWTVWRPVGDREPIPAMVMGHDGGQRLIDHARDRRARIHLTLTVDSPYLYDVMHVETDRVPERIVHRVTRQNSARFTVDYTDLGGFDWLKEQRFGWRPWMNYAINDVQRFTRAGATRQEWVSAGDTLWQHRVRHDYSWDEIQPLAGGMLEPPRTYRAGRAEPVSWYRPVVRPAAPIGVPGLVSTRTGDTLSLRVPEFVDATSAHYGFPEVDFLGNTDDTIEARLWRDGELVAELPDAWQDVATGPEPASYRLELAVERDSEEWQWAPRTETVWEFESGQPAGDDPEPLRLLQVDYQVPADLSGRVSGWLPHLLGLTLRHQDGLRAPWLRDATVEVSFDEGASWREVTVLGFGRNLVALVPAGSESVSLRVHAEATDGSAVTQTVIRAYGLK